MPEGNANLRLGIDPSAAKRGARQYDAAVDRHVRRPSQRATRSVRGVDGSFNQLRRTSGLLRGALAAVGIASVTATLWKATSATIAFEQAMTGVAKTVDAPAAVIAQMGDDLQRMSESIPTSANELASIAEAAGQLGIQTNAILGFTDVMAALGVSTNLSATEAATSLARLANVMQSNQQDFDRMGATVVDLGNNLATTEREIVSFATRMAGAGKIAGLTEANVLAIGGALSSVGVEAEAGGTAVQKVLLGINDAVARGGATLQVFARTAGMTAGDFAQLWQTDAVGAFTAFVEGLGAAGDDATMVLEDLGLNNQRLVRSFLSLANAGDLLRDAVDRGSEAWRENAALTAEAQKFYDTMGSDLKELRNRVVNFAADFAAAFSDDIRAGIEAASGALDTLRANMDKVVDASYALATAVGVTGLTMAFKALATSTFVSLIPAITGLRDVVTLLQISIGPAGWLLAGVTAITTAVYAWRRAHRGQAEELRGIGQASIEAAEGLRELSGEQLQNLESSTRADIARARYRVSYLQGLRGTPGLDQQAIDDIDEAIRRTRNKGIALGQQLSDVQAAMLELQTLPPIKITVDDSEVDDLAAKLGDIVPGPYGFVFSAGRRAARAGRLFGQQDTPAGPGYGIGPMGNVMSFGQDFARAAQLAGHGKGGVKQDTAANLIGTAGRYAPGGLGKLANSAGAVASAFSYGGPLLGGITLAGEAFQDISANLTAGSSAVENFANALKRTALEFDIFDIEDPREKFDMVLDDFLDRMLEFARSSFADYVGIRPEDLTPENLDEYLPKIYEYFTENGFQNPDAWLEMFRQLENLADQANEAADALGAMTTNIPKALPLEYLRQQAGMGNAPPYGGTQTPGGSVPGGPPPPGPGQTSYSFSPGAIVIQAGNRSADELLDDVEGAVRRRKGQGRTIVLDRYYQSRN